MSTPSLVADSPLRLLPSSHTRHYFVLLLHPGQCHVWLINNFLTFFGLSFGLRSASFPQLSAILGGYRNFKTMVINIWYNFCKGFKITICGLKSTICAFNIHFYQNFVKNDHKCVKSYFLMGFGLVWTFIFWRPFPSPVSGKPNFSKSQLQFPKQKTAIFPQFSAIFWGPPTAIPPALPHWFLLAIGNARLSMDAPRQWPSLQLWDICHRIWNAPPQRLRGRIVSEPCNVGKIIIIANKGVLRMNV